MTNQTRYDLPVAPVLGSLKLTMSRGGKKKSTDSERGPHSGEEIEHRTPKYHELYSHGDPTWSLHSGKAKSR